MTMAISLEKYLKCKGVHFQTVPHKYTDTAYNSALAAHIPAEQLVKAVVLVDDDNRYLMALVPSSAHLELRAVDDLTYSHFHMLSEEALMTRFEDCEVGAIPGIGGPWDMEMVVDSSFADVDTVYIEAGDHETLLKIDGSDFEQLVMSSRHATIAGEHVGGGGPEQRASGTVFV